MGTHHQIITSDATVIMIAKKMTAHRCKNHRILVTIREILEIVINRVGILRILENKTIVKTIGD